MPSVDIVPAGSLIGADGCELARESARSCFTVELRSAMYGDLDQLAAMKGEPRQNRIGRSTRSSDARLDPR